jgi:putative tricarboxylic transport membrane protein
MKKLEYEAAPLVLALVLGPMMESALRQSMVISEGNIGVFFSRPISATFLILAALIFFSPLFLKKRTLGEPLATE